MQVINNYWKKNEKNNKMQVIDNYWKKIYVDVKVYVIKGKSFVMKTYHIVLYKKKR